MSDVSVSHQYNIKFLGLFLSLSIGYENNNTEKTKCTLICYNLKVEQVMNMYGCLILPPFAL